MQLTVAGGRLNFHPQHGWRRLPGSAVENQLEVTLTQWWLALAPSQALARLKTSGHYAPLRLNVKTPAPPSPDWAVRWGLPVRPPCQPAEWVSLETSEWGSGCAFPGDGRWAMVVDGVNYAVPGAWPLLDVIWWGSFPLDLERAHLFQGEELQAWKIWLALQLCPITGDRRWAGVPLDLLLEHGGDEVWRALWYQRADGRPACLDDMQDHYDRWGFLPVTGMPGGSGDFFFAEGFPREMQQLFPNWAYVPEQYPRLPEGEEYLVRVPLGSGIGEVGLRANPGYGQRIWTEKGWRRLDRKPDGLDLSVESPQDYAGVLTLVYTCLSEMDWHKPAAGTFHMLCFVDYLIFIKRMRWPSDPVLLPHPNQTFGHLEVAELVDRYPVQMLSGETSNALEAAKCQQHFLDPNSTSGFVCDFLALCQMRSFYPNQLPYGLRSRRCHHLLEECQGPLLERLKSDPECAAYRILKLLPELSPAEHIEPEDARAELGQGSVILTTFHLLLALTNGVDRVKLLQLLPDWLEFENEADLAALEPVYQQDYRLVWLWGKVESLLRCQRWAQADEVAKQAAETFPGHWQSAYLNGQVAGFRGDWQAAYRASERALERGGPEWMVQPQRWRAGLSLGLSITPLLACERPLGMAARVLAAAHVPEPKARLETCKQLLFTPNCPASVHEVLGNALADLGQLEEARQCWRLFLAARHDQLMEFDLPARQDHIRKKLGRVP